MSNEDFDQFKDYFNLSSSLNNIIRNGRSMTTTRPIKQMRKIVKTENIYTALGEIEPPSSAKRYLDYESRDLPQEQPNMLSEDASRNTSSVSSSTHCRPSHAASALSRFGFDQPVMPPTTYTWDKPVMPPATYTQGLDHRALLSQSTAISRDYTIPLPYHCHGAEDCMYTEFQRFESREALDSLPSSPQKEPLWSDVETPPPSPSKDEDMMGLIHELRQLRLEMQSMKSLNPDAQIPTPSYALLQLRCGFCKQNGESKSYYQSHLLKDPQGRVICPVLRAYKCPRCHATGDDAHTARYCPLATDTSVPVAKLLRGGRNCIGNRRDRSLSD